MLNIPNGLTNGQKLVATREGGIYNHAYQDTGGVWTVGIGCTGPDIVAGTVWTDDQAAAEFQNRYAKARIQAAVDLGATAWNALDEVRCSVLTDIAYQDGGGNAKTGVGGLAGFHKMLAAVRARDWFNASAECKASFNERVSPNRCNENAAMLLSGAWPAWLTK